MTKLRETAFDVAAARRYIDQALHNIIKFWEGWSILIEKINYNCVIIDVLRGFEWNLSVMCITYESEIMNNWNKTFKQSILWVIL